jgi:hypothetical protein
MTTASKLSSQNVGGVNWMTIQEGKQQSTKHTGMSRERRGTGHTLGGNALIVTPPSIEL